MARTVLTAEWKAFVEDRGVCLRMGLLWGAGRSLSSPTGLTAGVSLPSRGWLLYLAVSLSFLSLPAVSLAGVLTLVIDECRKKLNECKKKLVGFITLGGGACSIVSLTSLLLLSFKVKYLFSMER